MLIGVAVVGVAMLVMLLWFLVGLVLRWRFQFSIRSLLVLTVAVAVPCSWLAVEMKKAREQSAAVDEITKGRRVCIWYDWQFDESFLPPPNAQPPAQIGWGLLGVDFFTGVVRIEAMQPDNQVTDAWMEHLDDLPRLQQLVLLQPKITDAGLDHLKALTHLQQLMLLNAKITDAGLEPLKGLTQLQKLDLMAPESPSMERKSVVLGHTPQGTAVTDAGVKKLQQALPTARFDADSTPANGSVRLPWAAIVGCPQPRTRRQRLPEAKGGVREGGWGHWISSSSNAGDLRFCVRPLLGISIQSCESRGTPGPTVHGTLCDSRRHYPRHPQDSAVTRSCWRALHAGLRCVMPFRTNCPRHACDDRGRRRATGVYRCSPRRKVAYDNHRNRRQRRTNQARWYLRARKRSRREPAIRAAVSTSTDPAVWTTPTHRAEETDPYSVRFCCGSVGWEEQTVILVGLLIGLARFAKSHQPPADPVPPYTALPQQETSSPTLDSTSGGPREHRRGGWIRAGGARSARRQGRPRPDRNDSGRLQFFDSKRIERVATD